MPTPEQIQAYQNAKETGELDTLAPETRARLVAQYEGGTVTRELPSRQGTKTVTTTYPGPEVPNFDILERIQNPIYRGLHQLIGLGEYEKTGNLRDPKETVTQDVPPSFLGSLGEQWNKVNVMAGMGTGIPYILEKSGLVPDARRRYAEAAGFTQNEMENSPGWQKLFGELPGNILGAEVVEAGAGLAGGYVAATKIGASVIKAVAEAIPTFTKAAKVLAPRASAGVRGGLEKTELATFEKMAAQRLGVQEYSLERASKIGSETLEDFIKANGGMSTRTAALAIKEGFPLENPSTKDLAKLVFVDSELKNAGEKGIYRSVISTPETKLRQELFNQFGIKPVPTTTKVAEGLEPQIAKTAQEIQETYASKVPGMEGFKAPVPGLEGGQITKPKIAGLNLRNVPAEEADLGAIVQQAAQIPENEAILTQAYRPMSRDEVLMAAENSGADPKKMLQTWEQGKAWNRQEMVMLNDYLKTQGKDIKRLNDTVDLANPEHANAFVKGWMNYFADMTVFTGGKSEGAAALRFARNAADKEAIKMSPKNMQAMEKLLKDPKERQYLQDFVKRIPEGDTTSLNQYITQFTKPILKQRADQAFFVFINGLLSATTTHSKNFFSNAAELLARVPITTGQATMSSARPLLGKDKLTYFGEPLAQIVGMGASVKTGVRNALRTLSTNRSEFGGISKFGVTEGARRISPIRGPIGEWGIGWSGKALQAMDEFFKTLNYGTSIYQQAYNNAAKEGLTGQALISKAINNVKVPTEAMIKKGYEDALYYTFTSPLKEGGKTAVAMVQQVPGLKFVQPFMGTPINLMSRGFEKTPAGFVSLALRGGQLEAKRLEENVVKAVLGTVATVGAGAQGISKYKELKGKERKFQITPQDVAVSSAMLGGVAQLFGEGAITGGAPKDPQARALFYQNKQAYSILVDNAQGGKDWWYYGGVEPFATILGSTADILQSFDKVAKKDAAIALSAGLAKQVLNKSFMQGFSNLFDAYSDPDRNAAKFLANLGFAMVPNSSLIRQTSNLMDPTLRKPDTFGDRIQSQIPGMKEKLPPIVDLFGNPVQFEGGILMKSLSPLRIKSYNDSRLMLIMERFHYSPKSVTESKDIMFELTPEKLYLAQVMKGKAFEKFGNKMIANHPNLENKPERLVSRILEKADDRAMDFTNKKLKIAHNNPRLKKLINALILNNQKGDIEAVERLNGMVHKILDQDIFQLTPKGQQIIKENTH